MTELESFMLATCFGISVGTVVGNIIAAVGTLKEILKYCKSKKNNM